MWPVKNKTIIGLKYSNTCFIHSYSVKNKTIIGLKYGEILISHDIYEKLKIRL